MSDDTQTLNTVDDDFGNFMDSSPMSAEQADTEEEPTSGEDTSEETLNTDDGSDDSEAKESKDESESEDTSSKGEDKEEFRFDKHPRWQEMLTDRNRAREEAKQTQEQLKDLQASIAKMQSSEDKGGKDYDKMLADLGKAVDDGDISMSEALTKQQEIINDRFVEQQHVMQEEMQRKQDVERAKQSFLESNPTVKDMLNKHEDIERIKATSPLHDDLTAAYALMLEQRDAEAEKQEAKMREAIEKAIDETEKKVAKNFQSKRKAAGLGASTAKPDNSDVALSDSQKFGGKTNVIAERLRRLRSGA